MHITIVFSKGQQIENDFKMNRSANQVEDFVVQARLDNSSSAHLVLLVVFWIYKGLSTLLSQLRAQRNDRCRHYRHIFSYYVGIREVRISMKGELWRLVSVVASWLSGLWRL